MLIVLGVDQVLFAELAECFTVRTFSADEFVVSQSMIIKGEPLVIVLIYALKQSIFHFTPFSVVFAFYLQV